MADTLVRDRRPRQRPDGSRAGDGARGGSSPATEDQDLNDGIVNIAYQEAEDGSSLTLSADLDWARYRSAFARIEIYVSAAPGDLYSHAVGIGETTVMVLDEEIRE